jgi:DNA-binding transcriptional LysR family regulator
MEELMEPEWGRDRVWVEDGEPEEVSLAALSPDLPGVEDLAQQPVDTALGPDTAGVEDMVQQPEDPAGATEHLIPEPMIPVSPGLPPLLKRRMPFWRAGRLPCRRNWTGSGRAGRRFGKQVKKRPPENRQAKTQRRKRYENCCSS